MRRGKLLADIPVAFVYSTYGPSSARQLIENTTDASFVAVLPNSTDGSVLAKVRETPAPTKEEEEMRP